MISAKETDKTERELAVGCILDKAPKDCLFEKMALSKDPKEKDVKEIWHVYLIAYSF